MHQIIPSLADLLAHFRPAFRAEAFTNFAAVVQAWVVCLGPRTLAEVWQFSVLQPVRHYCTIYDLFARAHWDWDELGKILLTLLLLHLVPAGRLWLAVDDTLCHKRGKRVAYGGIFLDPVLSSKNRKLFRFGVNYVVLALVVALPGRADHFFALPILWRVFRKKGTAGHQKKTQLARDLVVLAAAMVPDRAVYLLGDSAYVNQAVLLDRPANVQVIGPLPKKAALYRTPVVVPGKRGRAPKKGERLSSPATLFGTPDVVAEERAFALASGPKLLRVQVLRGVLWYTGSKEERVAVALVRDPPESWPDEVLLSTDVALDVDTIVLGYSRRWAVEVAFRDAKQSLGLHDPQVRNPRSVERAHPMSFFCLSLSVLWCECHGEGVPEVHRERPWYRRNGILTLASMLGKLRPAIWNEGISEELRDTEATTQLLAMLLNCMATVR
jgi:hypothetical protein